MHILFLSDNFPPEVNASASRVFERACYWVKWGHQVTVVTSAPNFPVGKVFNGYQNKWYQVEQMDGIRVVRVKTFIHKNQGFALRVLDFLSFMLTGFLGGLMQKKPDIVIATSPQFFCSVAGWFVSSFKRKPFIFEIADLWPASIIAVAQIEPGIAIRMIEKLELFLYRRAARVIAQTPAFKQDLVRRGIPADHIDVVLNGVDLQRFSPIAKDLALAQQLNLTGKFVVSYIGTMGMAHGLSNVIEAAKHCRDNPHIRFLLVGEGAERSLLQRLAADAKLNNVVFVNFQPKSEIKRYWSITDVALVHLKESDTFKTVIPSKIFEAMAMAKPILLVAPKGESANIVQTHNAGEWIPAKQPELLATTIERLAIDNIQLQQYTKNAAAAAPYYSREYQAKEVIHSLETALE